MVVAERIELSSSAYKTDALTVELCDIILVAGRGIEPRSLAYSILYSDILEYQFCSSQTNRNSYYTLHIVDL